MQPQYVLQTAPLTSTSVFYSRMEQQGYINAPNHQISSHTFNIQQSKTALTLLMHVISSVPHKMLQKDINLPIQTLATAYINIESPCDVQAQLLRHELTQFSYFFFLSNDLVYLTALVSCKRLENLTGLIQTLVFLPVLTVGPESRNFIPVNTVIAEGHQQSILSVWRFQTPERKMAVNEQRREQVMHPCYAVYSVLSITYRERPSNHPSAS